MQFHLSLFCSLVGYVFNRVRTSISPFILQARNKKNTPGRRQFWKTQAQSATNPTNHQPDSKSKFSLTFCKTGLRPEGCNSMSEIITGKTPNWIWEHVVV